MVQRYFFVVVFSLMFSNLSAQHQDKVDFIRAEVEIEPNAVSKSISGLVHYKFKILENVDSVFLDAKNMDFKSILLNHKEVSYTISDTSIVIHKNFKREKNYYLTLEYTAKPKQTVYFIGNQVWTQGQGKYTSHWLPSFDDMTEKVEFDLSITFDASYNVIANGKLKKSKETDGLKTWSYDMRNPMSSYLVAFAIGKYNKEEWTSKNGLPIENYYYPKDSLKVEPTYRYTNKIFDFLENEIGVPYPWQNYKQVPVKDFLYAGMENTGTTIFSDAFMIDSVAFIDKNYVNVNAHELAHQWFGNLVTEKNGCHHWLHEGFATYYAYLTEKEVFGDDYFYWKLYDTAQQLNERSKAEIGEALTDAKASSLTFYEKGAWALVLLRKEIGDVAFKRGIKNYLEKYKFQNVTIDGFLKEMELASGKDLRRFKQRWLTSSVFPIEEVTDYLSENSPAVGAFIKFKWELTTSLQNKKSIIEKYWKETDNEDFKAKVILKYHKRFSPELVKSAFNSNSIKIRRALALTSSKIPTEFKSDYESLLEDESYITQESALYRLWVSFPKDRYRYLNKTKGLIGLPNKNMRLLWLLLASLTKDYGNDLKKEYLAELHGYTSPKYAMEIRQNAFGLIADVLDFTDQDLLNLINATVHHSWRFRKYARSVLDKELKVAQQRKRIIELTKGLNNEELRYIKTKLDSE